MTRKLAFLSAAALLLSSCLPVPFDLALSQSAAIAKKMTRDNGPLMTINNYYNSSAHDFVLYPAVGAAGLDYSNGFVVSQQDLQVSLSLFQDSSLSGNLASYFGQGAQTIANPDPHAPPYLAWPLKGGPSYLLAYTFDALNPTPPPPPGNSYFVMWGDPFAHAINQVNAGMSDLTNQVFSTFGLSGVTVLGASVSADPSPVFDMTHWLGMQAGLYVEFSLQASSAVPAPNPAPHGVGPYPLPFIPGGISRCMYFYDENQLLDPARAPNRSFASWWDASNGGWVSYAWEGPPAVPPATSMRLPIDHRIDALLSTGQLLSTEDGTGRLYNRNGNLLATFPLGNLVYIAEEYVGGIPRCYFSQALVYDQRVHFNVYWIRTDQLSTLAN
jgi:hypothetical protein